MRNVPESAGEGWIFEDVETNILYDVSEECTITLIKKAEGKP